MPPLKGQVGWRGEPSSHKIPPPWWLRPQLTGSRAGGQPPWTVVRVDRRASGKMDCPHHLAGIRCARAWASLTAGSVLINGLIED